MVGVASPPASVAAVALALPFAGRLMPLAGARFGPLELAIGVSGLAVGSRALLDIGRGRGRALWGSLARPIATTVPALALLAVATWSLAVVAEPAYRRVSLREYRLVVVEPLLLFASGRLVLRRAPARRLLVGGLMLAGFGAAGVGIVQVVTGAGLIEADGVSRARGTFSHPNNLAFLLERIGLLAVGIASAIWPRRASLPALAAAAVVFAGLGATFSRGALLGVAAGFSVVAATRGRKSVWGRLAIGATAALVVLTVAAGDRLVAAGGDGRIPTRLLIWRAAVEMGLDRPLTGVGLDQFLTQYGRRYVSPAGWSERFTSHPHNLVLDLWLRLGILGPAVGVWLGVAVARGARRLDAIALGAAAALVGGVAHGLVDQAFFLPELAVMTWLLVALIETVVRPGSAIDGNDGANFGFRGGHGDVARGLGRVVAVARGRRPRRHTGGARASDRTVAVRIAGSRRRRGVRARARVPVGGDRDGRTERSLPGHG